MTFPFCLLPRCVPVHKESEKSLSHSELRVWLYAWQEGRSRLPGNSGKEKNPRGAPTHP